MKDLIHIKNSSPSKIYLKSIKNRNGQVVSGLVLIVGIVAAILASNMNTQHNFMMQKLIESNQRLELESAIEYFGIELYNAYLRSAIIPNSIYDENRKNPRTHQDPISNLVFNLPSEWGGKICLKRKYSGKDLCLDLNKDFADPATFKSTDIQHQYYKVPEFEKQNSLWSSLMIAPIQFFRKILNINDVNAEISKNSISQPDVDTALVVNVDRQFTNTSFKSNYSNYNCPPLAGTANLVCVSVKICLKLSRDECDSAPDREKILQTYIFTKAPSTFQRD